MHRPARVLIVDDATDNREAYAEYLRYRGFRITEASTGAEALAQAARERPDVMLLDMRLPDLDGTEVSRQVRRMRAHRRPKIIALSACVSSQDVDVALGSGCDVFLPKPCLPDVLEQAIRRLLRIQHAA